MSSQDAPYYQRDLALIHHLGFGFHADDCAPGILQLLEPVRQRAGFVVEIGCGSGLLTRYLIEGGHRAIATDASPAMLELAREYVGDAEEVRELVLPDDPVPQADAIVGVGHALNYLPSILNSVNHSLVAIAQALRPGGLLAIDLCDLAWAETRRDEGCRGWVEEDWALITAFSVPRPDLYIREMTTFVRADDGSWRRGHERHDNVMVDITRVPVLLAEHGVEATVGDAFGHETLPVGLKAIVGSKGIA